MTDKIPKSKPVTLEDYIPPEPEPKPRGKSKYDARLAALDKAVRDESARTKPKPKQQKTKSNIRTIVFYCVVLIIIINIID